MTFNFISEMMKNLFSIVRVAIGRFRQLEGELHDGRHPRQRRQRQSAGVREAHLQDADH